MYMVHFINQTIKRYNIGDFLQMNIDIINYLDKFPNGEIKIVKLYLKE